VKGRCSMHNRKLPIVFKVIDCSLNVASRGISQAIFSVNYVSGNCNTSIAKLEIDIVIKYLCEMECILSSMRDSIEILKGEILDNEL
jgi:hypothetical protein